MDLFYYAFALFLGSVYLAGRYYKEPEKLMWIYLAICVGLAVYTEMELYVSLLYILLGVFGYIILLYWHQEGVLKIYSKDQPIPYWIPILISQTAFTFVLFLRFYELNAG